MPPSAINIAAHKHLGHYRSHHFNVPRPCAMDDPHRPAAWGADVCADAASCCRAWIYLLLDYQLQQSRRGILASEGEFAYIQNYQQRFNKHRFASEGELAGIQYHYRLSNISWR